MFRKHPFRTLALLLLITVAVLSGCAPLLQPVSIRGAAPTPVVSVEKGGVDNPNVFVDPAAFQAALLQTLADRDTGKLQAWMTEPFLTGVWRAGTSDVSPADAIKSLYADQLGTEIGLAQVQDADLKALLGGKDPLSIAGSEAGVTDAFLVSGWGKDGRDEAILFVARQADNSLKWRGWMQVQGGFSGARLGGIQPYQNEALGFSLYLPKDFQVPEPNANTALFLGPGEGHPTDDRAGVIITVEPANGITAEQIATQTAEKAKADMGAGYTGAVVTALDIEGEPAYSVNSLPGQDVNRQLFMIHNDLLYHMMFIPDNPPAAAYRSMEDAYAMIVNTFHFTQ